MKGKSMNSKLGLVAAATLALSSSAFASDNFAGFSAGLGLAAVGSELEVTDVAAGDTMTDAQTSTVGLLDLAYTFQLDSQWAIAVGVTYDLNNIQAGQGKGIGYILMNALFDAAREQGLTVMRGEVLAGNKGMLKLMHKLGFTVETHPEDRALNIVTKIL